MKGLSLTLTVIVVAIALLVTVLVVITIFGGQMANFLALFNPWSQDVVGQQMCNQKCATWCQTNPGKSGPTGGWGELGSVTVAGESKECSQVMANLGSCQCGFVVTSGASGAICTVGQTPCTTADKKDHTVDVAATACQSTKCVVNCDAADKKTGTCQ